MERSVSLPSATYTILSNFRKWKFSSFLLNYKHSGLEIALSAKLYIPGVNDGGWLSVYITSHVRDFHLQISAEIQTKPSDKYTYVWGT